MSHVVNYRGIVSGFEVTFKHAFEGFTLKRIGDSLIYPKHTAFTINIHRASFDVYIYIYIYIFIYIYI